MSDDNPTLEEITSARLNMPLDSVPDFVAYAKKRFALAAVNHRIRASRQSRDRRRQEIRRAGPRARRSVGYP